MTLRPFLKPLPLLGLSASTLLLASSLRPAVSSTHSAAAASTNMSPAPPPSPAAPWPVRAYTPRHAAWPYTAADFARQDASADTAFYAAPRFVTHIDDAAIASLRAYYASVLPRRGRVLDFCASWTSHYPLELERAAAASDASASASASPNPAGDSSAQSPPPALRVVGLGLNAAELAANALLRRGGRVVHDLNAAPDIAAALERAGAVSANDAKFDAATNAVSIDYLTQPVAVLAALRRVMAPGARVHLAVSNRCFPTKAVARWLRVREDERLLMVADFLHFAGWRQIEIVELSDGTVREEGGGGEADSSSSSSRAEGGLRGLMRMMGMNSRDPLWVVRAVNEGNEAADSALQHQPSSTD